jgi:ArsR family transcriptional regulator
MLCVLERQELTVTEICAVLQLPQSTVSRHLKTLADADLVVSRRDGTSRYYAPTADAQGIGARIWEVTRGEVAATLGAAVDSRRLERVLARRSEMSQQFFASAAGQWDRVRDEMFGADFALRALVSLLPDTWTVGDLGCGTGAVVATLAPHVGRVIGVDASAEMLAAAQARVGALDNVDLRRGTLEALPLEDQSLDAAVMMLVLHHLPAPAGALAEARRVLKPGGRLLVVDMLPHEHEEYRRQMGHVWLGFGEEQIARLLAQAGLTAGAVHALRPATDAKVPNLFAVTAHRRHR